MEEEIKEIRELAKRNYELIKSNEENIKDNFERINQNSYTLGILRDYKREALIWKIAFFIILALFVVICVHHFIIE